MAKASLAFFAAIISALMLVQPVSAGKLTSTITDSAGDAFFSFSPPGPAPGYLDIVSATITLRDGQFILFMDMAGSIPASPTLPSGTSLLEWAWELNTNPTNFILGFPFPAGKGSPIEYIVQILWDGRGFTGQLIDRTPLLSGGAAMVTPLSFSFKGGEFSTSVGAAIVGNPSSFLWGSTTRTWSAGLGNWAWFPVDDTCCIPRSWPS